MQFATGTCIPCMANGTVERFDLPAVITIHRCCRTSFFPPQAPLLPFVVDLKYKFHNAAVPVNPTLVHAEVASRGSSGNIPGLLASSQQLDPVANRLLTWHQCLQFFMFRVMGNGFTVFVASGVPVSESRLNGAGQQRATRGYAAYRPLRADPNDGYVPAPWRESARSGRDGED